MSDRPLLIGGGLGALLGAAIGFVVGKLLSRRRAGPRVRGTVRTLRSVAFLISAVACAAHPEPLRPSDMTRHQVATQFATALALDDLETARQLVCPRAPDPERQGTFPFENVELVGPPSSDPPPNTFVVVSGEDPPDLYVRFEATADGQPVDGSVEVAFGTDGCIEAYAVNRATHSSGDEE